MSLPFNFRETEIKRLLQWAWAGESALVIGASGVGKSNLFNHLLDPKVQAHYLQDKIGEILFIRVNFHYAPDFNDRTVFSLILDAIERHADLGDSAQLSNDITREIGRLHDTMLDAGEDTLRVLHIFRRALRFLFRYVNKLVILCDQFDDVYQGADARLFASLRGLRESYKYRLLYFLFTRDPLDKLAVPDASREEFDELFASKVMGLKPYCEEDAFTLCRRIASRLKLPYDQASSEQIYRLTGGHAGLLRAVFLAVVQNGVPLGDANGTTFNTLLKDKGVANACTKLLRSLSITEQRLLLSLAGNKPSDVLPDESEQLLWLKGLVKPLPGRAKVFAPIWQDFILNEEHPWEKSILLDEGRREVWIYGRLAAKLQRTKEFGVLRELYRNSGDIVTRGELIAAVWPEAYEAGESIFDQALDAVIYRLRRTIEENPKEPKFILTERGVGYMLSC